MKTRIYSAPAVKGLKNVINRYSTKIEDAFNYASSSLRITNLKLVFSYMLPLGIESLQTHICQLLNS